MNETNIPPSILEQVPIINLLPQSWRLWVVLLVFVSPFLARGFYALRNGGGIKGFINAIWIGTNTPKGGSTEETK